ncbi:hypothetical protein [uncultured Psychroserpens sp.]|uniref:hypothetical protein n=1 Tax=uncultured Psychroserpens sp. TaxID=255436 RepID=UPI00260D2649|nr:hypothetical protein [uncultured Psychroserpens sp.]
MIRRLFLITLLLVSIPATSQTADDILEKYIEGKKVEQQFQADINYALYKGVEGTKAYESFQGVLAKNNGTQYQKLGSMELVQGENFVVKLNSEEKAMLVGYSSKPIFNNIGQLDNEQLLKVFDEKNLIDNGDTWILTLTSKVSQLSQFTKIEIHIRKSDLQPQKQVFLYNTVSDFSAYNKKETVPNYDNPRLEIVYKNYQSKITLSENLFKMNRYFEHSNNQIIAAKEFKGFEILHAN